MGAVASAVSDVVGGAVDAVGTAVEDVGQIVEDVAKPVVKAVDDTVKAAVNDPIGTTLKVAAVATGNPELLPLISGGEVVANGGSIDDALKAGATTYVAGEVGGQVGGDVTAGTDSSLAGTVAGGASGAATGAVLTGRDPVAAALAGGINAFGNTELKDAVHSIDLSPSTDTTTPTAADTGFDSSWQISGTDRIQIQDDGTAIGINENGEMYNITPEEVTSMIDNGMLNTDASGYTAAYDTTDSTSGDGNNLPVPKVNFASSILGTGAVAAGTAGGATATPTSGTVDPTTTTPDATNDPAPKITQASDPSQLNPLLYKLFTTQQAGPTKDPFSDIALGTSSFAPKAPAPSAAPAPESFAQGGLASMHPAGEPEFYSEGGLGNRYIRGRGDGTSDDIPAMVANNEFVMPADVVAALGNGSSDAGASKLDQMVQAIRKRARSTDPSELPPPAHESPLDYLKGRA